MASRKYKNNVLQVAPSAHSLRGAGTPGGSADVSVAMTESGDGSMSGKFVRKLHRIFDYMDRTGDGTIDKTE